MPKGANTRLQGESKNCLKKGAQTTPFPRQQQKQAVLQPKN